MNLTDLIIFLIIFFIGITSFANKSSFTFYEKKILFFLFLFHLSFSFIFNYYLLSNGGDALKYWNTPKRYDFNTILEIALNGSATERMYLLNFPFSGYLDMSFLSGNLIYNLIGFIGFVYYFKLIKYFIGSFNDLRFYKMFGISFIVAMWFLPNLHFWTAGIGKDTLIFTSIPLFLYSLINYKSHLVKLIISLTLIILIRPHILFFLISGFGLSLIFQSSVNFYKRVIILTIFSIALILALPYLANFVKIDNFEISTLENFASTSLKNLNDKNTSSGLDVSGYSFPMKIFTFLYRPMFLDGGGFLSILSSFENLFLLLISLKLFRIKVWHFIKKSDLFFKSLFIFVVLSSIAFSQILGNLGIMLRQKNMIIPSLLIFIAASYVHYQNNLKSNNAAFS